MDNPKVSIIVPIYRVEEYIEREDRDSSLQTDQWVLAKLIGRACPPPPRKRTG